MTAAVSEGRHRRPAASNRSLRRPAAGSGGSDVLARTRRLAHNLWWTWNPDAQRLFASLDPELWQASGQDPIKTLKLLAPERAASIAADPRFIEHLARCERALGAYLNHPTWFASNYRGLGGSPELRRSRNAKDRPARVLGRDAQATDGDGAASGRSDTLVAYFCAEYAVAECLPQYSGGLGVLAGDHVKAASDLGVPFVGLGLLYRNGFYTQEFAADGSTKIIYPQLDFADLPITDTGKVIDVPMGRGTVAARVWRQVVGRVTLYLLDTDLPRNKPPDRNLTAHLYGGDREYRIRQEILLGVGGLIALDALGLKPTVYHLNEGHAAFCALERLRRFVAAGMSLPDARNAVRGTTVFTTHTPVPAGNDRFVPPLTLKYLRPYAAALGISEQDLLAFGREEPANRREEFCMTVLALRLAEYCNGVAQLHGEVSRRMWTKVYGVADPADVPIGAITNGVHTQTWLAEEMTPVYEKYLKVGWLDASPRETWWENVGRIPDGVLWSTRNTLRAKLVTFARQRLAEQIIRQHGSVEELIAARTALDANALTVGFARRFATYKRAPLVFHNPKRLARILGGDAARPVQLLFAGKAHPHDLGGQGFAREIFRHARTAAFRGRVVLLEDYDMQLGRMLTSGADVWLNNPLRPQEASGTSGMKPPLHGGVNCSILDGWWPEAYDGRNGWAIGGESAGSVRTFKSRAQQDRHDADSIYDLLETRIVPEFYARDRAGVPVKWVTRMKHSMRTVCGQFNTHRMVGEYFEKYYLAANAKQRG